MSESVRIYLIDRAGAQANAFADKLAGHQGIEMVGGATEVDEALADIVDAQPDVILVGTDVGGAGVVSAVERVLAVTTDAAVVALCTRADKALVDAAVRIGAAGSLDRAATAVDTITALHTYHDRQHGMRVDMRLAEPPAERQGIRVSGALPRFPAPVAEEVSYLNEQPLLGAVRSTPPAAGTEAAETAAEYVPPAQPEPVPAPEPVYSPPPPEYAPAGDPASSPDPAPAEPDLPAELPGPESAATESVRPAGMDDGIHQMREMLRGEAVAAHGPAPEPERRGLFRRRKNKDPEKGSSGGHRDGQDEETKPS